MLTTIRISRYKAFGLNVLSDFPIPELQVDEFDDVAADVVVRIADLSSYWNDDEFREKQIFIKENIVVFHIPYVAIYEVKNGNEISISPFEVANIDKIRLYLLSTCMATILLQRKILPFHASTIAINGKAYAITGSSGVGKSTLAKELINKGYNVLSDDVVGITLSEKNIPIATPSFPCQQLWKESLDELGLDSGKYRPIYENNSKYVIPIHHFKQERMPLAGIFELIKSENEEIKITKINKLERIRTVYNHTFRRSFMEPLGLMEWHFDMVAKMVNKLEFYQIERPITRFTANELATLLLTTIHKEDSYD
ncbi:aldolase [Fredinandcohnia quinoae]|uniref:Aldolase n=1 Tax=Fredinandcohnia quinoae TaxID=2918902 RepID=A0AAW5DX05_9BACI|nr:aldolase [Fredinandcohnia sp. SECRCQ15]MCH1624878.1 aldolase [Fredinandcohnia sp. SECRCQ15]